MKIMTLAFLMAIVSGVSHAKEAACITRSEMGETTTGEYLHERDADLKVSNLSRIDFDLLTVTSVEGKSSRLVKVTENIFRSGDPGDKYQVHFITNSTRSIVTELSISETATYIKILLCKWA